MFNAHIIRAVIVLLLVLVRPNGTCYCSCYYWPYSYKVRVPITALIALGSMWLIMLLMCSFYIVKVTTWFTPGFPLFRTMMLKHSLTVYTPHQHQFDRIGNHTQFPTGHCGRPPDDQMNLMRSNNNFSKASGHHLLVISLIVRGCSQ